MTEQALDSHSPREKERLESSLLPLPRHWEVLFRFPKRRGAEQHALSPETCDVADAMSSEALEAAEVLRAVPRSPFQTSKNIRKKKKKKKKHP